MEKFQELRELSKKRIRVADHMLTMTYPLVQDSKLLLAVVENIFLALTYIMGSVLHYERTFKRIPLFQDDFSSKFNMFSSKVVGKYNISAAHISLIQDIRNLIIEHKKSPVEFTRKDNLVICSDNYSIKTVSVDALKNYISKAKLFIDEMSKITAIDESIFNNNQSGLK